MTDNNLETLEKGESRDGKHNMTDNMEAHEKEESGDEKHNQKGSDDKFDIAKTAIITRSRLAKDTNNLSDDQKSDSGIDEMSVLSTSFSGVNRKYVKDLRASFQSIADIAREMKKSELPDVTKVSTIVVLVL